MKSFGTYISKHLASFAAFLLILVIVNVVLYGVTFYHTVSEDYGEASPRAMLELTSTAATTEGLPDYAEQKLRQYNIWAMYLTSTGECFWRLDSNLLAIGMISSLSSSLTVMIICLCFGRRIPAPMNAL